MPSDSKRRRDAWPSTQSPVPENSSPRALLLALNQHGYGTWSWGDLGTCYGLHAPVWTTSSQTLSVIILGRQSRSTPWLHSDYERPARGNVLRVYGALLTHDAPLTVVHEVRRWTHLLTAVRELHTGLCDQYGRLQPFDRATSVAGKVAWHWGLELTDAPQRPVPAWEATIVRYGA